MIIRVFPFLLVAIVTFSLSACGSLDFFTMREDRSEERSKTQSVQRDDQREDQSESRSKMQSKKHFKSQSRSQLKSGFRGFFNDQPENNQKNRFADQLNNVDPEIAMGAVIGSVVMGLSAAAFGGGFGKALITTGGIFAGAYVGSLYMQRLGERDRQRAEDAAQLAHTFPIGQTASWRNPSGETSGSTTPILEGIDDKGRFCRQYQHNVTTNSQNRQEYATLCLGSDGRWRRAP